MKGLVFILPGYDNKAVYKLLLMLLLLCYCCYYCYCNTDSVEG